MTRNDAAIPIKSKISVIAENGVRDATLLRWEEAPDNANEVKLLLEFDGIHFEAQSERGFFRTLCMIREQVEELGMLVKCYGSSINVYPSPMIESMGCGEKAYRLELGKPALMSDLVVIFDSGVDVEPSKVSSQQEFYKEWINSLK